MLATAAAVSLGMASTAFAETVTTPTAPVNVIPPVINWDNAINSTTGATLHNGTFSITADRRLGDAMMLDLGNGFRSFNGVINISSGPMLETSTADHLLFGSGGSLSVLANNQNGTQTSFLTGNIKSMELVTDAQINGYDFVGKYSVTGGLLSRGSRHFNREGLLFGLIYNVNRDQANPNFEWTAKSKGNIANLPAPPVPEPTTLALLSMGLGSLVTVTRRKLAKV